jgi:hypothetical protein
VIAFQQSEALHIEENTGLADGMTAPSSICLYSIVHLLTLNADRQAGPQLKQF